MISKKKGMKVFMKKIAKESDNNIIGNNNSKRKYFTNENNDIIYKRLKKELTIQYLPYLGPSINFGLGDICLEETDDFFKFYVIDRASKFEYEEFNTIEDAISKLITYYKENEIVDSTDKMKEIFYQTLGLKKQENLATTNKGTAKVLKPRKK